MRNVHDVTVRRTHDICSIPHPLAPIFEGRREVTLFSALHNQNRAKHVEPVLKGHVNTYEYKI